MIEALGPEEAGRASDKVVVVHAGMEFARHGMCAMLEQLGTYSVRVSTSPIELYRLLDNASDATVILGWDRTDCTTTRSTALECRNRGASVIILLHAGDENTLDGAIQVPVDGYLLERDLTLAELDIAVARVGDNEVHLPAAAAGKLLESIRTGDGEPRAVYGRMTPREQQVLELLVDGLSNKQIARMLHISQHGVKRLVSNVLSKLCCSNRTSAVSVALREGLVQRSDGREAGASGGLEHMGGEPV